LQFPASRRTKAVYHGFVLKPPLRRSILESMNRLDVPGGDKPSAPMVTVHGFRVLPCGRISPGFRRALGHLGERGYRDPGCVVVKTTLGRLSGVTHEGGRYVHPKNPCATEIERALRDQGIEPPPPPFVVAPGECTLYHEWGHHVDRAWSGDDQDILFSFRWFSHFYSIRVQGSGEVGGPLSELECSLVIPPWQLMASELFADLFEDWMRGGGKLPFNPCDPWSLALHASERHPGLEVNLRPGISPEDVRARTFGMFPRGLRPAAAPAEVRSDFLSDHTERMLRALREAMRQIRGH
jgi:hypothetical protein